MTQGKSIWSWLASERQRFSGKFGRKDDGTITDEDNPWLALSEYPMNESKSVETRFGDSGEAKFADRTQSLHSRWLDDQMSPYGFSDDDGTLKQVENRNWRKVLPMRKQRTFTANTMQSKPLGTKGTATATVEMPGGGWMLQTALAAAAVVAGLYGQHGVGKAATTISRLYNYSFSTDYSATVLPGVDRFLRQHNISVPSFLATSGALRLHAPLSGTIQTDYSSAHPEMMIVGSPKETVLSVGSGTVSNVQAMGKTYQITIDHGTLGMSVYTGVGTIYVRTNEYVSVGQVIGRLPATEQRPVLGFSIERNGKYVNPHDLIHFNQTI